MAGEAFLKPGSVSGAALSLAVATVGAGILALPSAFADAGVLTSIIVTIVVAFFTVHSIRYLAICIEALRLHSYESIARELLGPTFESVVRWMLIIYNFGVAVSYIVAAGQLLDPFHAEITAAVPLLSSKAAITAAYWAVAMLPLVFVRHISALNKMSVVAIVAIQYIALAVVYRYFIPYQVDGTDDLLFNHTVAPSPSLRHRYGRHSTRAHRHMDIVAVLPSTDANGGLVVHLASWDIVAVLAIPIMFFAYDCQALTFKIYDSLDEPSIRNMSRVGTISAVLCFVVYCTTGLFGYLANGQYVRDNILNNYDPHHDMVFALAYALYAVPVNLAYALILFPVRDAILNFLHGTSGGDDEESHVTEREYRNLSVALAIGSVGCAVVTPGLVSLFSLLGAVCGSTICFIYPALFRIRLHQLGAVKASNLTSERIMWAMLSLGIFGATFGTGVSVYKMLLDSNR